MSVFPVTCDKCGAQLPDVEATCPTCGPAAKTVHLAMRAQVSARASVSMTLEKITEEVKKNWPLIIVLVGCDVISVVPAYFLSGWASVSITVFFIVLSTVLGYFAITRVIRITKETH